MPDKGRDEGRDKGRDKGGRREGRQPMLTFGVVVLADTEGNRFCIVDLGH
jgi:hypothetical protein